MDNIKIFLENGVDASSNGVFYINNSKYYYMYTLGEKDDNPEYIKLYVVQVCKEVKNTEAGPVDTGYMLGLEINEPNEWKSVQGSIAKIVEDKKNNTKSPEIQYLPKEMLVNLKIVSKNKFKLLKQIIEENFKVVLNNEFEATPEPVVSMETTIETPIETAVPVEVTPVVPLEPVVPVEVTPVETLTTIGGQINNNLESQNTSFYEEPSDVIIDYRSRFFEEQAKNAELEEQIKQLTEKLENIKNIIG